MAYPSAFLLPISLLLLSSIAIASLLAAVSASSESVVHRSTWAAMTNESGSCQGATTAECMDEDDDLELYSYRQTANTDYISYGALKRDTVPCSQRGGSYYNCKPGAEANPYDRGCSAITRCRS
ncbi:hypothetical protein V6N11_073296 [Hibiscus sabdariffa]|uniref:Uncharacterized protein n=2 Tax=Hibiscus sabdariffa TaxID=183260 RepID=A0ABR2N664_9ROSI